MSSLIGIQSLVSKYLDDSKSIVDECVACAGISSDFSEIYRISLSADSVLAGLSSNVLKPSLNSARGIVLRVPMLSAIGQTSVAKAELRRFLELFFRTIYFTDHAVEWKEFQKQSGTGFARDQHKPISFSAHRELGYYFDYAKELMEGEPSGLGVDSLDRLREINHRLNAVVHPGHLAITKGKAAPFEIPNSKLLREFSKLDRAVFSNSCIILAAYRRTRFDVLNASSKAQFDWLVGAKTRKMIRSGPFGLR